MRKAPPADPGGIIRLTAGGALSAFVLSYVRMRLPPLCALSRAALNTFTF